MKTPLTTRRAFTLIELLVVIAIIAILAGLMFPSINGALDAAKKTTAKNDAVQIANAVMMYETEYGKLPPDSSTVSGTLLAALMATTTTDNKRQIVFLEGGNWKKGKGGVTNSEYRDPWGNAYNIAMDTAYTNGVTGKNMNSAGTGLVNTAYRKRVVVWNEGKNDKNKLDRKYFVNSAE